MIYKITFVKEHIEILQLCISLVNSLANRNYKDLFNYIIPALDTSDINHYQAINLINGLVDNEVINTDIDLLNKLSNKVDNYLGDPKIVFIADEKEIELLLLITEVYYRLGLRQFDIMFEKIFNIDFSKTQNILKIMNNFVGCQPCSLSTIDHNYLIAMDIHDTLRYEYAWSKAEHKPEQRREYFMKYMTLDYDKPIKYSYCILPLCEHSKNIS
jgi:hypothetical protein